MKAFYVFWQMEMLDLRHIGRSEYIETFSDVPFARPGPVLIRIFKAKLLQDGKTVTFYKMMEDFFREV